MKKVHFKYHLPIHKHITQISDLIWQRKLADMKMRSVAEIYILMCFIVLQFVTSVKTAGRNYMLRMFCCLRLDQISRHFPRTRFSTFWITYQLIIYVVLSLDSHHSIGVKFVAPTTERDLSLGFVVTKLDFAPDISTCRSYIWCSTEEVDCGKRFKLEGISYKGILSILVKFIVYR